MNEPVTMHTGPLGSTVHVLRADAETVVALAGVDWSRHFRRVCLDPVRGVITLMSPSRLHEDLSLILDDIVDIAGSMITRGSKGLRSTRLRGRGEPPGTGDGARLRVLRRRARTRLSRGAAGGECGGRRLPRAQRPRSRGGNRDYARRCRQGRTLRADGCAGAVATAWPEGYPGAAGGVLRAECRERTAVHSTSLGCSKGSRRGTCARRSRRCGSAEPATNAPRRLPASYVDASAPAYGCARRRGRTRPSRTEGSARWSFPGTTAARFDRIVPGSRMSRRRIDPSSARTHPQSARAAVIP